MKRWKKQIEELLIPYPQKRHLVAELEDHTHNVADDADEGFEDEALDELVSIHNSPTLLFLRRLSPNIRNIIELSFIGGPLMGLLTYLISKGGYMYQFFINGGAPMYAIFAIGLLLLGREALLFTRVMILKEHTKANLQAGVAESLTNVIASTTLAVGVARSLYNSAASPALASAH